MALFVDSMVILRPTRKVRLSAQERETREFSSDTALGDWYVNRIIVHRQPLLILISSVSLLPTLTAARDVQSLPDRLADLVGDRLVRLGIQAKLITAEKKAMQPTSRSNDRSARRRYHGGFCKGSSVLSLCRLERKHAALGRRQVGEDTLLRRTV